MNDINKKINQLKIDTEYPKTYKKLVAFKKDLIPIYPVLDSWFFKLGFDMVVTPVINERTEDVVGYVAGIQNYKKNNYFNSDLEFITVVTEPLKNRAICYSELVRFIFNCLEEYYTWNE